MPVIAPLTVSVNSTKRSNIRRSCFIYITLTEICFYFILTNPTSDTIFCPSFDNM